MIYNRDSKAGVGLTYLAQERHQFASVALSLLRWVGGETEDVPVSQWNTDTHRIWSCKYKKGHL
jgi:hypothetical protein